MGPGADRGGRGDPGPGAAGPAVAAYASRAGIDARIFMPKDARPAFVRDCELAGAVVTLVDGPVSEATVQDAEKGASHRWYHVGAFREPALETLDRLRRERNLRHEHDRGFAGIESGTNRL